MFVLVEGPTRVKVKPALRGVQYRVAEGPQFLGIFVNPMLREVKPHGIVEDEVNVSSQSRGLNQVSVGFGPLTHVSETHWRLDNLGVP